MEIPEVFAWVLQYGCPEWERRCVQTATKISREEALKKLRRFDKKNLKDMVPRALLFAAGVLDSPWRCKTAEMMQQEAVYEPPPPRTALYYYTVEESRYNQPILPKMWPTLEKPQERPAKRSRLMGEYKLVATSTLATPKKDPRWKELQQASGFKPHAFCRALQEEGFKSHKSHSVVGVVEEETRQWVQLA
jgi:hypothetical protein